MKSGEADTLEQLFGGSGAQRIQSLMTEQHKTFIDMNKDNQEE